MSLQFPISSIYRKLDHNPKFIISFPGKTYFASWRGFYREPYQIFKNKLMEKSTLEFLNLVDKRAILQEGKESAVNKYIY